MESYKRSHFVKIVIGIGPQNMPFNILRSVDENQKHESGRTIRQMPPFASHPYFEATVVEDVPRVKFVGKCNEISEL